jgi:hypothetical protein
VQRISPAKAAVGDKPVLAYIASLPQPQRGIADAVDALAAKTPPDLRRSVKWGMSYYGVGDGWCFRCGGFADHVKLMFVNGAALEPVPPVTPLWLGKSTRGVELETATICVLSFVKTFTPPSSGLASRILGCSAPKPHTLDLTDRRIHRVPSFRPLPAAPHPQPG